MVVTIKDLARQLQISPATVSLALNDNPAINQETARRVKEAAQHMGYVRNQYARGLARGRTGSIALVVPDVENQFFSSIIHHVANACKAAGYDVTISITNESYEEEWHILRRLCQERVEAILLAPANEPPQDEAYLAWLRACKVPLIFVSARYPAVNMPVVMCDLKVGMRQLTEHLLAQGMTDIALLTGNAGVETLDLREEGYAEAMGAQGLPCRIYRLEQVLYRQAYDKVLQMPRETLPQSLLCVNDMMAVGAINALQDNGLRVPEDIRVAGFDDSIFSRISGVPVSTMRQDVAELARQSVELAVRWINDGERLEHAPLPCDMILRRSTEACGRA